MGKDVMPLRAHVEANPETLSDFLLAADDRYREAEKLLEAEEYDGCVYLLGYAVEIWLKSSCLRLRKVGPTDRVLDALSALKGVMEMIAPRVPCPKYWRHDLSYFVECMHHLRTRAKRPLSPAVEQELRQQISSGLYEEWAVEMRYRRSALTAFDAWKAFKNARWMKKNWVKLIQLGLSLR